MQPYLPRVGGVPITSLLGASPRHPTLALWWAHSPLVPSTDTRIGQGWGLQP